MPGGVVEIEEEVLEVMHGVSPHEGIDQGPHYERDENAHKPTLEKLPGRIVYGKLKITGCYHKKGHTGPCEAVQDGHPDCVCLGEDLRPSVPEIKYLTGVSAHHKKAGHNPEPVYPNFPLVIHGVFFYANLQNNRESFV